MRRTWRNGLGGGSVPALLLATAIGTAAGPAHAVFVVEDAAFDGASNGNAEASVEIADGIKPVATLTMPGSYSGVTAFSATIAFDEDVTGLSVGDLRADNATVSNLTGSGTSWAVDVTPDGSGEIVLYLAADAAVDGASNGNVATDTSASPTADAIAPVLTIAAAATYTSTAGLAVTFAFDEDVTEFTIDDITVTNATRSGFTSADARSYSVTVTPDGWGLIDISVAQGAAEDASGTGSESAGAEITDGIKPVASLTMPGSYSGVTAFSASIAFDEDVTGLSVGDLSADNATVSNLTGSGTSWAVDVTPDGSGAIVLYLAADAAVDAAGNGNVAADTSANPTEDGIAPVVSLDAPASYSDTDGESVTITFSEPVTGFGDAGDVTVTGGSWDGTWSDTLSDGTTYEIEIVPDGSGTIGVFIEEDAGGYVCDGQNEEECHYALPRGEDRGAGERRQQAG